MKLNLPEQLCDCGCGRRFKPRRKDQRFFEAACRKKFHAEEMVTIRRDFLCDAEFVIEEIIEQEGDVSPTRQMVLRNIRAALKKKKDAKPQR
jgi:hypothetical protein